MNWFEKTLIKISVCFRKLSVELKDYALASYGQRMIDQQLPPQKTPWGNFETREGEHEHV